jgi:hypothetical protein
MGHVNIPMTESLGMGPNLVPQLKIYLWILDQTNFGLKSKS